MSVRRACVALALTAASAAGCGEQDRERPQVTGTPEPTHAAEVERDPYALTCADLARQPEHPESQKP